MKNAANVKLRCGQGFGWPNNHSSKTLAMGHFWPQDEAFYLFLVADTHTAQL